MKNKALVPQIIAGLFALATTWLGFAYKTRDADAKQLTNQYAEKEKEAEKLRSSNSDLLRRVENMNRLSLEKILDHVFFTGVCLGLARAEADSPGKGGMRDSLNSAYTRATASRIIPDAVLTRINDRSSSPLTTSSQINDIEASISASLIALQDSK